MREFAVYTGVFALGLSDELIIAVGALFTQQSQHAVVRYV